ncbi:MAG: ABC transporter permease [Desulfobacterales bacterium]|nr:ABC transporter permease [Desulfobacterales bacterium]MDD4073644.1 ABC transporter permease [Desulfobacterales bacterium]MDD4391847.1 ABC transporter permease [Desulfobacterales bacterium]
MFVRLKSLIKKEFLVALRDPKARMVLIVPPLIQIFVFSFAMTQEARNVSLGVLNLDSGSAGFELVERFQSAVTFTKILRLDGNANIRPILDEQRATAVLIVPSDFSADISSGRTGRVQLLLDGRKTNTSQIVRGYAMKIVQQFIDDMTPDDYQSAPAAMITRHWFNPNLNFKWYTVPSLVCVLATIVGLILTSLSVSREREMGTFEQILVTPLRPVEILIGKAVPSLILAAGSATLLITVGIFAFRIPFQGSLALLFGALTIFLLSIIGIGLFISALSMTQQQAILGVFVFMPPAVLLSGFATPIENMPAWLQTVTAANPLRWFLVIVRGIFLKDMPAADVLSNAWPLAVIALVTLAAATWLFRHRME